MQARLPAVVALAGLIALGCGDGRSGPAERRSAAAERAAALEKEPPAELPHHYYPSAVAALEAVLAEKSPRLIAFGELHQTHETAGVRSTIERFASELLPAIADRTSDLVVEAWVSEGDCGEEEKRVVSEVERVSRRPDETEDENIELLSRAKELGVRPHILQMSCEDYRRIHRDGGLDYAAMLELVADRLGTKAREVLGRGASDAGRRGLVAVFGGEIHNDLHPPEDFAGFTFAPELRRELKGGLVEVDVLVPEFVEAGESSREEPWYELAIEKASPDKTLLIERGPGSYLIVMKKGVPADDAPTADSGR
ncbi:MAG: hypothetical protein R6V85_20440 [Polyangia bacterium]